MLLNQPAGFIAPLLAPCCVTRLVESEGDPGRRFRPVAFESLEHGVAPSPLRQQVFVPPPDQHPPEPIDHNLGDAVLVLSQVR